MIYKFTVKRFCKDFTKIENFDIAMASSDTWDCHHRLELDGIIPLSKSELIGLGLYYNRPAEELIFLRHSEHMSLHQKGERNSFYNNYNKHHSEESKYKMSIHHSSNSGHKISHTDIGKKCISESLKGKPKNNKGKNNGIHKIATAYKEYKANGGTEKWKAFQVIYKKTKVTN